MSIILYKYSLSGMIKGQIFFLCFSGFPKLMK